MKSRFVMLAIFMAAGCASPENHYYTLSPSAADNNAVKAAPDESWTLNAVTVPDLLDWPQMIVKSGPNGILRLEYERWAEPLESMTYRVLSADLVARSGLAPSAPAPGMKEHRVNIVIDELDVDEKSMVYFTATWTVKTGEVSESHIFSHSEQADLHQVSSSVARMSHMMGMLADAIVSTH